MAGKTELSYSAAAISLAQDILRAYPEGAFPMARAVNSNELLWYQPQRRGVLPIGGFHASRSLKRQAKSQASALTFSINTDFAGVITACGARSETWINPTIRDAFCLLHENNLAHSFEVRLSGKLIGGMYGLALGGAFMGESMFSHETGGSKLTLWFALSYLEARGFTLFDTQFISDHLESLGGIEIPHEEYIAELSKALSTKTQRIESGEYQDWKNLLFKVRD